MSLGLERSAHTCELPLGFVLNVINQEMHCTYALVVRKTAQPLCRLCYQWGQWGRAGNIFASASAFRQGQQGAVQFLTYALHVVPGSLCCVTSIFGQARNACMAKRQARQAAPRQRGRTLPQGRLHAAEPCHSKQGPNGAPAHLQVAACAWRWLSPTLGPQSAEPSAYWL